MEALPVQTLREAMSEYVARAESGHVFLVVRHSEPLAVLRPGGRDDVGQEVGVSRFRTDLRVWLQRADRNPLRLTWRGRRVAIVERVPASGRRGEAR
jgi:prevent-host-death family protein